MFSKVAKIICTAVFTLIHRFQNSPNVNNNLFGPLLIANLLPRTLKIAQSGHNGHGTNGKSFFLDKVQQIVTKKKTTNERTEKGSTQWRMRERERNWVNVFNGPNPGLFFRLFYRFCFFSLSV